MYKEIIFVILVGVITLGIIFFMPSELHTTYAYSPSNGTWTNQTNYTLPFYYNHTGAIGLSPRCFLVANSLNSASAQTVLPDTNTVVYDNYTFIVGRNQWYVNCTNAEDGRSELSNLTDFTYVPYVNATLVTAAGDYHDLFNTANLSGSWGRINFTAYSPIQAKINCSVYIDGIVRSSSWVSNASSNSINITGIQNGINMPTYVLCRDNASNFWNTSTMYINVDNSSPVITYTNVPLDGYNSSASGMIINFTVTDNSFQPWINISCNVLYNSSGRPLNATENLTIANNSWPYVVNLSGLTTNKYEWYVKCWDWINNSVVTARRNFTVDIIGPQIFPNTEKNITSNGNMIALINFTVADINTTISSCGVNVSSIANTTINTSIVGTMNMTGSKNVSCAVLITSTNLAAFPDGLLNITPYAYDGANPPNLNYSLTANSRVNWTKMTLYAGWNLIAVPFNGTMGQLSNISSSITVVSLYNSTKSYTSFTAGTSTNENVRVVMGQAVWVYANATSTVIIKYDKSQIDTFINASFTTFNTTAGVSYGYNQWVNLNSSGATIGSLCFLHLNDTDAWKPLAISYPSPTGYVDSICSAGLTLNNATIIPFGRAYWISVNGSYYVTAHYPVFN